MKDVRIVNKTYQPFQLVIGNDVVIIGARKENNEIIINESKVTKQIENLIDKGFLAKRRIRK